jgi:hypothetical protein
MRWRGISRTGEGTGLASLCALSLLLEALLH